jgi:Family of unknown function (DUF6188)
VSGYVIDEVDGTFELPLGGFISSETRGEDLILRSADSTDEAWVTGIEEAAIRDLVDREARVARAVVSRDSTLQIDFEGGAASVVIPPEDEVEAWEVRGPGCVLLVALPGGGEPAIWDSTSEIRVVRPGDPLPPSLVAMLESFGLIPAADFELRCTKGQREGFELHPPNAARVNRGEIVRIVPPG